MDSQNVLNTVLKTGSQSALHRPDKVPLS